MERPAAPEHNPSQSVREWRVILALTAMAAVLRFWAFGRLGLTHFDEGVYAQAGAWAIDPDRLFQLHPKLIAYAPPGFAILIGLAYSVFGVSDASALLVSAVCGVLTIPIIGWLGRRLLGAGGGAAAATFAALSLAHVAFSRKALTDVPFLCAWLISLGLGVRFLERPVIGRALAFGFAVGLAQNFKYNGWVCLAVVALAAAFGLTAPECRRPRAVLATFGLGFVATLTAAICYWPWFAFVESQKGGYASLLRHHSTYLGGPASWPKFLAVQLAQVVAFSGGSRWSVTTCLVALIGVVLGRGGDLPGWLVTTRQFLSSSPAILCLAAALALFGDLGWWVGLAWFFWLAPDSRPGRRVLAAWWLVLSVMTPFYHPYARLWLPLHAAGWLLLGSTLVTLVETRGIGPTLARSLGSSRVRLASLTVLAFACLLGWRTLEPVGRPRAFPVGSYFRPTDDLRNRVSDVASLSRNPETSWNGLSVLGRPPLVFYLDLQGGLPFRLLSGRRGLTARPILAGERALVDDVEALPTGSAVTAFPGVAGAWRVERSWRTRLDPVTLLDVNPSAVFQTYRERSATLYFLAPRSEPTNARLEPVDAQ